MRLAAWLGLATFLIASPARATVLANWDLDEVVRRSDLIVIGTIGKQRSIKVGTDVMTESEVLVEETLRGEPTKSFTLSQLGGKIGTSVYEIVGDAKLGRGDRVLLLTYLHKDGRRYLVGMSLGAYFLSGEHARQTVEVPLVESNGGLRPAPGLRQIAVDRIRAVARARR